MADLGALRRPHIGCLTGDVGSVLTRIPPNTDIRPAHYLAISDRGARTTIIDRAKSAMSHSQTNQSWSERISDAYEDDYNDLTDQQKAHPLNIEDDERSHRESARRFADIEEEFKRIHALSPDGMGDAGESVEDEYDRLQVLRNDSIDDQYGVPSSRSGRNDRGSYDSEHESRDRFPDSSGRPKYGWRTARYSGDTHTIEPTGGPVYVEAYRSPSYPDANQRHNRGRSGQSTISDPVQGLRDVLLAPYIGEPQQAYISRMERDGEILSAAVVRYHDIQGRWRPFVAEAKDDYIQRIDLSEIEDKPTRSESEARWDVLEGRFRARFGEGFVEYLDRLSAVMPADQRPSGDDCLKRWKAMEAQD
ncbi:hypothetical protein LTS09_014495 [Friedmanniomyces endolithicus]|nr:hypothetical protein LTS09_014495 [Friedmanniomyces endolithicus]